MTNESFNNQMKYFDNDLTTIKKITAGRATYNISDSQEIKIDISTLETCITIRTNNMMSIIPMRDITSLICISLNGSNPTLNPVLPDIVPPTDDRVLGVPTTVLKEEDIVNALIGGNFRAILSAEQGKALFSQINDETDRAQLAESGIMDLLTDETDRAQLAESNLQTTIDNETDRAQLAESGIMDLLTNETDRAQLAESNLQTAIDNVDMSNIDLKDIPDTTNIIQNINVNITDETDRAQLAEDLNRTSINKNLSLISRFSKDIMTNSTEIRMLNARSLNDDLSIMIDTFEDNLDLDPTSENYEIVNGHAGLTQSTSLIKIDSTKGDFDNGIYHNCESIIGISGEISLQKTRSVVGEVTHKVDFPMNTRIVVDGEEQGTSSVVGTFIEGSFSAEAKINFPLPESGNKDIKIYIDDDLTDYRTLEIMFKKSSDSALSYDLAISDTNYNYHWYSNSDFITSDKFQSIILDLKEAKDNGIDLSSIDYISMNIRYSAESQEVLNLWQTDNRDFDIYAGRFAFQTFVLDDDQLVQMVKVSVRRRNSTRNDLNVAIANAFGTTLAVGRIDWADATTGYKDYYILLDKPVVLKKDFEYRFICNAGSCEQDDRWEVEVTRPNQFPQFTTSFDSWGTSDRSISLILYKPPIDESIFIDDLKYSKTSIYDTGSIFESRPIDLSIRPSRLDNITWINSSNSPDTISVKVRTSDTEDGLSDQNWSSAMNSTYYNSLSGISPRRWVQYQISWLDGNIHSTTTVKNIKIEYTTPAGQGTAIIISATEVCREVPLVFMSMWDIDLGASGTVDIYISRDGKNTWQLIESSQENTYVPFVDALPGKEISLKAVITGDANISSWGVACEEEFI